MRRVGVEWWNAWNTNSATAGGSAARLFSTVRIMDGEWKTGPVLQCVWWSIYAKNREVTVYLRMLKQPRRMK